jgi:cardiolipin synthase C
MTMTPLAATDPLNTPRPTGARAGWLAWALLALLALLPGCASTPAWQVATPSSAMAPRADSPFAALEQPIADVHGSQASGFRLLESNADGLLWRMALVENARHSLDLQYYVWFGDVAGQALMRRVVSAANRGVRVRLLFDDLNTMLKDMTSPALRDDLLGLIDRHPNIEIRVFNAWRDRDWFGRVADGATDFARLNRRMHNKQFIADNRAAILGGRNIGDEYMGINPVFNFHDLDVLGVGPVARQASEVFDRYWNSDWVRRIPGIGGPSPSPFRPSMIELPEEAIGHPVLKSLAARRGQWGNELQSLAGTLSVGRSAVHADPPSRAETSHNHMPEAFRALMRSARSEVMITNAYIIPDENFMADLRDLATRGVKVRILTNSLASHDVPAVNAHYEKWRVPILQTGADLHEMRQDAAIRAQLVDTPPVQSGFVGLHTKAMVVDRQRSFIGSMNLDPRSEIFNSEMGVIVESPALAEQLALGMLRDMGDANSWQLRLDRDGTVRWHSDSGVRSTQPARNFWQRVQNVLFKVLPASYY